jgi:hypothetical protein
MRHGPGSPPEVEAPAPVPDYLAETAMIARALDSLTQIVGRLDGRMDRILALQSGAIPNTEAIAPAKETDKQILERELDALLAEIARVRAESEAVAPENPGVERASEPDTRKRLGKLRRRQASILARLLEIEGDPGAEEIGFL